MIQDISINFAIPKKIKLKAKEKELIQDDQYETLDLENIHVQGARVHNLKNVDIVIPRNKLTVITGLSGSGKSSLAFDTIYAEGQRRYIETFSAYARQFLGNMERPDVDRITGLSPVISIEQKTVNRNPRSTVGTITEIYDFLRLLFARAGEAYSYISGEKMVKYTDEQILKIILEKYANQKIFLLAPIVRQRKGHYKELFELLRKKGFLNIRLDGEVKEITENLKLDRYKIHNIELVIDKFIVNPDEDLTRIKASIQTAMHHGKGVILILNKETEDGKFFSRQLMCPTSGIAYDEPAPNAFSFNSPQGACTHCDGLGEISVIDYSKIIPDDTLNIENGGIAPIGKQKNNLIFWQIESIAKHFGFGINTPIKDIPKNALDILLFGSEETFTIKNSPLGNYTNYALKFEGIIKYLELEQNKTQGEKTKKWVEQFYHSKACPECQGDRLNKIALNFKINDKNIADLSKMDISDLHAWINQISNFEASGIKLSKKQQAVAKEILKELSTRVSFLLDVGLDYLSLHRSSRTLSGGESQRIRLATQIGSQLVNVLYILDEPSIGLHQRDNQKLIHSLKNLRDTGNTVIVVEHDKEMILASDYVIDIGPRAGKHGGEIVGKGTPSEILKFHNLTSDYLNGTRSIEHPAKRRKGNGHFIEIEGAKGNNLKNVSLKLPLGVFICITGVSGSGKSSLISDTLLPVLKKYFYRAMDEPLSYKKISGQEFIDKVIEVDQAPIGRTPRSNPATYTDVFTDIRKIFEQLPESKIRAYKAGRFSFNVKGGRCETCQGGGMRVIEMNFLPDVYVHCEDCSGKRYNRETLEVRYKGKSISDVLNMTIEQAYEFFQNIPQISLKMKALLDVGLGYITLGQSSTTLSGGEAQRIKLAAELARKDTGNTLYILDEPTTGLHFEDIRVLLEVLNRLTEKGNTIIVIEHNLDVVKCADYIIDMGPEGGKGGGKILFEGTPEEMLKNSDGYTSQYLANEMK